MGIFVGGQVSAIFSRGQIKAREGTAAEPGISFFNAPINGMFPTGTDKLSFSANAVERLRLSDYGVQVPGGGINVDGTEDPGDGNILATQIGVDVIPSALLSPLSLLSKVGSKNSIGFGIDTILTDNAGTWTAGDVVVVINGTTYTESYSGSKSASMTALASQLTTDANVSLAVYLSELNRIVIIPENRVVLTVTYDLSGITGTMSFVKTIDHGAQIYRYGANQLAILAGTQISTIFKHDGVLTREGTSVTPGYRFFNDTSSGMYSIALYRLGFAAESTHVLEINKTKVISAVTVESPKVKLTAEGGIAIKLVNNTGGNSVVGQIVKANGTLGFTIAAIDDDMPIGICYEVVANGADCWVVVSGIADVLIDAGGCTIGYVLYCGATSGSATAAAAVPAALVHFREVGHALSTRVGAGLAKAVIHFN
jgi:hypothetical protein